MFLKKLIGPSVLSILLSGCVTQHDQVEGGVQLTHGFDASAGGGPAFIVTTPNATYYLEKEGGGLSSMLDVEGVDWIGFHNKAGSGHKGEYRGFPNAVHKQDGSYFHAMNAGTDPANSNVEFEHPDHVRITVTSDNGHWKSRYDFYPDRLDFTMTQISSGYKYWVQYEGVPYGEMDKTDFWFSSADKDSRLIEQPQIGDLPYPEWMAFGDVEAPRMLYVLHHEDDPFPDNYVSRPDMTVLGFGRADKEKHLTTPQTFSIGFVEGTKREQIDQKVRSILK